MADRSFALVGSRDQWLRCAHDGTHLNADGVVGLSWSEPEAGGEPTGEASGVAVGLAFDGACRLYRTVPEEGRVVRMSWKSASQPGRRGSREGAASVSLFERPEGPGSGGFRPRDASSGPLRAPRALAVDPGERLFVAETGAARILVYDLRSRELLRTLPLAAGRPLDLAVRGGRVLVLTSDPATLLEVTAREVTRRVRLRAVGEAGPSAEAPGRLAVGRDGRTVLLDRAGEDGARILFLEEDARPDGEGSELRMRRAVEAPGATDLAFDGDGRLVVARRPGEDFLRFAFDGSEPVADRPLRARGYDGRGIVRSPDGRILFWSSGDPQGPAHAVVARVRHGRKGRVTTFRLDSGTYGTHWGRLYLEACIPDGCDVRVATATADEVVEGPRTPRIPPSGPTSVPELPGESPPLPPASLMPAPEEDARKVHRRESGSELPWTPTDPDDPFEVFEAPVASGPGRYLWVVLELSGNTRHTPLVRTLRAHHPGHDLLARLPRVFSRDPDAASFLRRYLSMIDGFLSEVEGASAERHALLDPEAAPEEALPWLASFLGLVLDDRWPEEVRRRAVDEAPWLFRNRGTVRGLRRFVEIYTGEPVVVVEHFRLRSMGGELVGESSPAFSRSVVGAGLRVGGEVGSEEPEPLAGTTADAFRTHAHRFTVLVGRSLDPEEEDVVNRILEVHRPAHTSVELCTADQGMRVGRGLHVGLTSFVGPTAGFGTLRLGSSTLGGSDVMGRPGPGTRVGEARIGHDSEVG